MVMYYGVEVAHGVKSNQVVQGDSAQTDFNGKVASTFLCGGAGPQQLLVDLSQFFEGVPQGRWAQASDTSYFRILKSGRDMSTMGCLEVHQGVCKPEKNWCGSTS